MLCKTSPDNKIRQQSQYGLRRKAGVVEAKTSHLFMLLFPEKNNCSLCLGSIKIQPKSCQLINFSSVHRQMNTWLNWPQVKYTSKGARHAGFTVRGRVGAVGVEESCGRQRWQSKENSQTLKGCLSAILRSNSIWKAQPALYKLWGFQITYILLNDKWMFFLHVRTYTVTFCAQNFVWLCKTCLTGTSALVTLKGDSYKC